MNDPQPRPFTLIDFLKNFIQLAMTYPKAPAPYPFVLEGTTLSILHSLEPRVQPELHHSIQSLISAALLYRGTGFYLAIEKSLNNGKLESLFVHAVDSNVECSNTPLSGRDVFITPEETIALLSNVELRSRIRELDKSLWLKAKRHLNAPSNGCHPSRPNWLENGINPFNIVLYLYTDPLQEPSWEPVRLVLKTLPA